MDAGACPASGECREPDGLSVSGRTRCGRMGKSSGLVCPTVVVPRVVGAENVVGSLVVLFCISPLRVGGFANTYDLPKVSTDLADVL